MKVFVFFISLFMLYSCGPDMPGEETVDDISADTIIVEPHSNPQVYKIIQQYQYVERKMDSLELFETKGNKDGEARLKIELAEEFRASGNYMEAIGFLEEVRGFIKQNSGNHLAGKYYRVLAAVYFELYYHSEDNKSYLDSADYYAHKSGGVADAIGDDNLKAQAFNIIGAVNNYKGDYQKAKAILTRALQLDRKVNDTPEISILTNLSSAYLELGNLDSALYYAERGLEWSNRKDDDIFSAINYRILTSIFEEMGNKEKAARMKAHYDLLASKKDVMVRTLMTKQLLMNYEKQQADSKILGLYQDRVYFFRLSWLLIAGLIFVALVGFLVTYLVFRNHQKEKKVVQHQLAYERKEREYHQARATILDQEKKIETQRAEKSELANKVKEQKLLSRTILLANQSRINQSIKKKLMPFKYSLPDKLQQENFNSELKALCKLSQNPFDLFEQDFTDTHTGFYDALKSKHNSLTDEDLRLCALLKTNVSISEITHLLLKSREQVKEHISEVRNKLGVKDEKELVAYLQSV